MTALQTWYTPATGLYPTTGWWNSANAITVLANYARVSGRKTYVPVLKNTFRQAQTEHAEFLNKFYDDEGWWALAWIDAYDLTGKKAYLAMSQATFEDMAGGWDSTVCGGGIWWSKDRQYNNAIAEQVRAATAKLDDARRRDGSVSEASARSTVRRPPVDVVADPLHSGLHRRRKDRTRRKSLACRSKCST